MSSSDEADDWMSSFENFSSSTETISELSKSIDLEFYPPEARKKSQARSIPPPLKLVPESESREESLVFDEDRVPTPASPFFYGPRHQQQRSSDDSYCSTAMSGSVASFRARFSTFSIDNSCFDLGAMSGENSAVGTPVEKVAPKDMYSSILLEKVAKLEKDLTEQRKDLEEKKSEFFLEDGEPQLSVAAAVENVTSGPVEGGVGAGEQLVEEAATVAENEPFPREEEEKEKEEEIPEQIFSESSDDEKEKGVVETLTLSPSPPSPLVVRQRGGRMSIRAVRKTKSVSETDFSFSTTSKKAPPKLDLIVGGPGAPPLPPSPPCTEDFIFPTKKKIVKEDKEIRKVQAGKRLGNVRVIDVLKVKIVSLKGIKGQPSRPLFLLAKLDQKDIYSSAPIYRETCEQFGEFIKWEGTFQTFRNLHLVVLEAPGKSPRPIGRIAVRRRELVNRSGEEISFPLKVVSKFPDVQGQICLDLRRDSTHFSLRVVDYSGLTLREPTELSLVVENPAIKESTRKLRIHAGRFSEEWLDIPCDPGPLQLKMTLWQEFLRGLNNVFHGQVRVDVDERWSNGPSKWFYLRPRHSDQPEETEKENVSKAKDQLGEVRLWMSYTADHVLNAEHYKPLMDALAESLTAEPFSASLISVLENLPKIQVDLSVLSRPLVQTLAYTRHLRPLLISLYNTDLDRCQDMNTLFRSQTLASKMLYELLKLYGHNYLLITMKPIIDRIYKENKTCEIDPARLGPNETLEKNMNSLLGYFSQMFGRLVESATRCPEAIRLILNDLRRVVAERTGRLDVERLALSSFVIMRFFAASLLSPKLFGLKNSNPEPRVARTLVLLSKMLQRLANCCVADQPLNTKEPWLTEVLTRVTDDAHKSAMVRFLDRISLHVSDPSLSTESIAVLKEGYLLETRSRQRPSWRKRLHQKKRYVILTETEILWQKSHRGEYSPKGVIALHEITQLSIENKNIVVIKTEKEEMAFESTAALEANEWLATIERQRNRAKKQQSSKNDLHDLIDNDLEREMEAIHLILVENLDLLNQWKTCLDSGKPAVEGARPLPVSLDGSLLEDKLRQAHRTALLDTLNNIIKITYAIETVHCNAIEKFHKTMQKECGSGSKESPIGDDGYLLLKRQLHLR